MDVKEEMKKVNVDEIIEEMNSVGWPSMEEASKMLALVQHYVDIGAQIDSLVTVAFSYGKYCGMHPVEER